MKLYVHEINQLRSGQVTALYEAIENKGLPLYQRHGVDLVGYWEVAPGQGPGPETVAVWEFEDFDHYIRFLEQTYSPADRDWTLREWLDAKSEWVASTEQLLCLPGSESPSVAELRERGTKAKLCTHEMVHTAPNRQAEYTEMVTEMWWHRCAKPAGRSIIGLYYCPWKNTRSINIWGQGEEWADCSPWGKQEGWYDHKDTQIWSTLGLEIRTDFDDRFLVPAPFSTVR